jgi:hypothetical protein
MARRVIEIQLGSLGFALEALRGPSANKPDIDVF